MNMKFFSFTSVVLCILSITSSLVNTDSKRIITMSNKNKNLSSDFATIGDLTFSFLDDELTTSILGDFTSEYESDVSIDKYQWGLDRIDQNRLPLDKNNYEPKYTGKDIDVYIVDTGIDIEHPEFEGRAFHGISFYGPLNDDHGHGTHVASTVAGKTVGVAPEANVIGVKVLNNRGSGSTINVIKGIEWIVNNYKKTKKCSVINMSLGGGKSSLLNNAVEQAYRQGIVVVVSAGNENNDASRYSPASAKNAITVGSCNEDDERSYFSNYGEDVDIFAPGSDIVGAKMDSKKYIKKSGTSMSAPHVSGAVAQIMEEFGCQNKKKIVKKLLNVYSIDDVLSGIPVSTDNKLLQIESANPKDEPEEPEDDCTNLPCWIKCLMKTNREDCESVSGCNCKWKSSRNKKCQIKK